MLTAVKLQLFFEPCNYFPKKNKHFFLFFIKSTENYKKRHPKGCPFVSLRYISPKLNATNCI